MGEREKGHGLGEGGRARWRVDGLGEGMGDFDMG